MKIDFHTHGKLAKKLPFSADYISYMFQAARKSGLDALCLTEHFNTDGFEELCEFLYKTYPQTGDAFSAEGILVFPGMEVDIAEAGHILVLGKAEDILHMNRELAPYKAERHFLPFSALMETAASYQVVTGAAHPFRKGSNIPALPDQELKRLDFIDLNGKDYATAGERAKNEVLALAQRLGLPVVAGSDTHCFLQFGCVWNEMPECSTILQLAAHLREGSIKATVSDNAAYIVNAAGLLKNAQKNIHALGGDYLSILIKQ